jgi:hypothetical protein
MSKAITQAIDRRERSKRDLAILVAGMVVLILPAYSAAQTLDQAAPGTPGSVTFENSCDVSLTILPRGPKFSKFVLAPGTSLSKPISSFQQGGNNTIFAYPNLADSQCPDCDQWTDLGGPPGTKQRAAFMWQGDNVKFATYCHPSLSGRGICKAQHNCCGPGMVQDGTFGTIWEFTPHGAGGNDYANLSTNAGSGPYSPPPLCGSPGADPDDCVSKDADIFYNVPIAWSTSQNCSFTTQKIQRREFQCTSVDCSDAYQRPKDDKQVACPQTSPARSYTVTYCGTSLLPPK